MICESTLFASSKKVINSFQTGTKILPKYVNIASFLNVDFGTKLPFQSKIFS